MFMFIQRIDLEFFNPNDTEVHQLYLMQQFVDVLQGFYVPVVAGIGIAGEIDIQLQCGVTV